MRAGTRRAASGLLALGLLVATGAAGAASIGVAPFERRGPEGRVIDVAPRLAQRLGAAGFDKVVGPAEFGARRTALPTPDELEAWGRDAGVENVLVGRVTRFGESLSLDAWLYDALTAVQIGQPIVAEVSGPDDLGRVLDEVARSVVGQLRGDADTVEVEEDTAEVASRPPSDEPLEIKSDGLSFEPSANGGRQMDFEGNVRIVKGPLLVTSRVARANYPPGKSSPDEIVARGDVVIHQDGRTARCREAEFDQVRNRMVCTGTPATLVQGCDRVRGRKITFSLTTEELNVQGDVEVKRIPGCEDAS